MKRFKDLTPEELEKYTNGCGIGKLIHNSIFEEACRKHDFHYEIWNTADKKILADLIFLKDMFIQIIKVSGQIITALAFFFLVITLGWLWFYIRNFNPKNNEDKI